MGKTVNCALWLDAKKTSPYEFYQYWRNIQDSEVRDVLKMLTFLPMDEVNRLSSLEGEKINEAKKIAAFEITKLIHGEEEATKAKKTSEDLFENLNNSDNMPTENINENELNMTILDLLVKIKIAPSKGQAKTLVEQGGISINDIKITDIKYNISKLNDKKRVFHFEISKKYQYFDGSMGQIRYSEHRNMKKSKKEVDSSSWKGSISLKGLKKGKKYYVQFRTV